MAKHLTAEEKNLLRGVMAFSREKRVTLYIVGGFLRDLITGREKENRDIDLPCRKMPLLSAGRWPNGSARDSLFWIKSTAAAAW